MSLPHALELWDNAARSSLPIWLYAWLGLLVLAFVGSLFFVREHRAARWALVGFATSHLLVVGIEMLDLAVMRKGLVSVTHVIGWAPVLFVLIRALQNAPARSAYGMWCRALGFIIAVSLIFDLRDAVMYLYYALTGHAVFGA